MLGMNKARTKHPLLQILFYSDLNMDLDLVMDLNMVMVVVVDMDMDGIPSINLVSIVLKIWFLIGTYSVRLKKSGVGINNSTLIKKLTS